MKKSRDSKRSRLGYERLEPRRLLNADLTLSLGVLNIDNFIDSNGTAGDETLAIRFDSGSNSFVFELNAGEEWIVNGSNIGSNIHTVAAGDLTDSLIIDDSANINFDLNFDTSVDAIDLSSLTGQVSIAIGSGALTDSGGAGLTFGTLNVTASGSMTLGDDTDFDAAQVTFNSTGAVSLDDDSDIAIAGANTANSLTLTSAATIDQAVGSSITVDTTTSLSATDDICLVSALNDFVGQVDATGTTIELVDRNALTVGDIGTDPGTVDVYLRSGATESGVLTLNGDIFASDQVLLQSDSGVVQDEVNSVIDTTQLLLGGDAADEGSGFFELDGANDVEFLAADLQNNFTFNGVVNLELASRTYASSCGVISEAIDGVTVGGDWVVTLVDANLTQTAEATITGTSNLSSGTGFICLVDATNDFVGQVDATGNTIDGVIELVDRNALTVGDIGTDPGTGGCVPAFGSHRVGCFDAQWRHIRIGPGAVAERQRRCAGRSQQRDRHDAAVVGRGRCG